MSVILVCTFVGESSEGTANDDRWERASVATTRARYTYNELIVFGNRSECLELPVNDSGACFKNVLRSITYAINRLIGGDEVKSRGLYFGKMFLRRRIVTLRFSMDVQVDHQRVTLGFVRVICRLLKENRISSRFSVER